MNMEQFFHTYNAFSAVSKSCSSVRVSDKDGIARGPIPHMRFYALPSPEAYKVKSLAAVFHWKYYPWQNHLQTCLKDISQSCLIDNAQFRYYYSVSTPILPHS